MTSDGLFLLLFPPPHPVLQTIPPPPTSPVNAIVCRASSHETDENGAALTGALKGGRGRVTQPGVPESLYCPLETSCLCHLLLLLLSTLPPHHHHHHHHRHPILYLTPYTEINTKWTICLFAFNLAMSSDLKYSCFLIQSDNLCPLKGLIRLFTFNIIIGMVRLRFTILLFPFCLLFLFFAFTFWKILQNFSRISSLSVCYNSPVNPYSLILF